jgi:hypothetical protein
VRECSIDQRFFRPLVHDDARLRRQALGTPGAGRLGWRIVPRAHLKRAVHEHDSRAVPSAAVRGDVVYTGDFEDSHGSAPAFRGCTFWPSS